MGEEAGRRRIDERPSGRLAPPRRPHPARLHQHVQRALRDLDAPYRLDLGAADRLVIGDDRQRLDGGAAEPARLITFAAEDVGEIRRGLEMPAPRSEEHTSELQSLMRNSYAVFCLKTQK